MLWVVTERALRCAKLSHAKFSTIPPIKQCVIDMLADTGFPDVRFKTLIQSINEGNIIIIPREGSKLIRLLTELDKLKNGEKVATRNLRVDHLIAAAQRIFRPHALDVKEVVWWSVYEIGQRLTDKFDYVPADDVASRLPHVFICGDACQTHSPKAGQGMNVSMGDACNLGWKLANVLQGRCAPDILHSYSAERPTVAEDLVREWSCIMSETPNAEDDDTPVFQRYFIQHGRYTTGMLVQHAPSNLTGKVTWQSLACGLEIGTRFHPAQVVHLADAQPLQLGHVVKADTRWHLFAFCPDENPSDQGSAIAGLCHFLAENPTSPIRRFARQNEDIDAVIDVRAIFSKRNQTSRLKPCLSFSNQKKGRMGLADHEKMFCSDLKNGPDTCDLCKIDRKRGCLVIVRPDQYVAHVLPFNDYGELAAFFGNIMLEQDS